MHIVGFDLVSFIFGCISTLSALFIIVTIAAVRKGAKK